MDGRLLTLLSILGVAGLASRGSRGVVRRAGRDLEREALQVWRALDEAHRVHREDRESTRHGTRYAFDIKIRTVHIPDWIDPLFWEDVQKEAFDQALTKIGELPWVAKHDPGTHFLEHSVVHEAAGRSGGWLVLFDKWKRKDKLDSALNDWTGFRDDPDHDVEDEDAYREDLTGALEQAAELLRDLNWIRTSLDEGKTRLAAKASTDAFWQHRYGSSDAYVASQKEAALRRKAQR
jgi:hypothetical protein